MKAKHSFFSILMVGIMLSLNANAAELTTIFDSTSPTAPEGTASVSGAKADSGTGGLKCGSDGNYVEWILDSSIFTAAKFEGYINTTNKEKIWAFQFTTDKGTTWSEETTQFSDGVKEIHSIDVTVDIPAGANGIRIIRRAGTSTYIKSVTLITDGGTPVEPKTDDAALTSILILDKPLSGFKPDVTDYNLTLTPEQVAEILMTQNVVFTTRNTAAKATWDYTPIDDNNGLFVITVVAEDGVTTQYYNINIKISEEKPEEPVDEPVVPASKLTIHKPEQYETMTTFGGYGGTLAQLNGREYEVYYLARFKADGSTNCATVSVSPTVSPKSIVSTNETPSTFDSKDGWFVGRASNSHSSLEDNTKRDEFEGIYIKYKMHEGDSMAWHVSGFDQFRLLAKDKKVDTSKPEKNQVIDIYIDGVKQKTDYSQSETIRTYDMTAGEHVIVLKLTGSSDSEVYGWSLRVTDNPLVKHLSGNDSTQTVNQTQAISPIKYAIKHFVASNLKWNGSSVPGISLEPLNAAGDTLQLAGIADAPVGKYSYTIEALDSNGKVSTSVNGTFSIKTELKADTTNNTVWITDPMQFDFTYYALNASAIHLTWTDKAPTGLSGKATGENTYSIVGTPTVAGEYPYTISIDGGNTLSGTIYVEVPAPQFVEPVPLVAHAKPGIRITDIVWGVKFAQSATVTGLPEGLSGTYSNGKLTISGTPAALSSYPQTFDYTITAQPQFAEQSSASASGQIIIIDPNAKSLLYLYKDNYEDAVYKYLSGRYDVTARATEEHMRAEKDYSYYNLIVISENVDANNEEVLDIITRLNKPVLNMKAFTYSPSRLDWGNPDNGSIVNKGIVVVRPEHPIFSGYNANDIIPLLGEIDLRGIQPVEVTLQNSLCLAVAPTRGRTYEEDGAYQTAIHEVPGELRGKGITARYLLVPVSQRSVESMSFTANKFIDDCISYLTENKSGYKFTLPKLQITSFSVAGVDATINESNKTITCIVPDGTDLTKVAPAISLADKQTHTIPAIGDEVDLSQSQHFSFEYTVSDYINTVTYTVVCRTLTALEDNILNGIFYDAASETLQNPEGVMLYIYNVMGQLVSVANSNMSMSNLPRGLYLIQSSNAVKKIMR